MDTWEPGAAMKEYLEKTGRGKNEWDNTCNN
jgi:hypothetical protein